MKKLVKCKSCGMEIAKNAKACPHCGAKQNQWVAPACVAVIVVTVVACMVVALNSGGSASVKENAPEASQSSQDTISFSGNAYAAEYIDCSSADGVSGAFYITLNIQNTGDAEQTYLLDDVYVDGTHCDTGTGLPVTAAPGTNVNGSFIVFSDAAPQSIGNIDFRLSVMDSETYQPIETSESVTIHPNA